MLDLYNIDKNINNKTLEWHLEEIGSKISNNKNKENVIQIVNELNTSESKYALFIKEIKKTLKEKDIKFKLNTIYSEDYEDILNNLNNLDKFKYTSITTKALNQEKEYYVKNKNLLFSPFNTFKTQLKEYLSVYGIKAKDEFVYELLYNLERFIIEIFTKVKDIVDHSNRDTVTVKDIELLENLSIMKK